jgi:hypothetical protein
MLHVAPDETVLGRFRLRWFDAPPSCNGQLLAPTIDGTVDVTLASDARPRGSWAFGGDASGTPSAVVAEVRREGTSSTMTLAWLEPAPSGGWRVGARLDIDGEPMFAYSVHVHGGQAVVHDGRRMLVVRRKGEQLAVVANRVLQNGTDPESLTHVLRFDGELVYVTSMLDPVGVVVLRARDLERLARFETHGLPRSVVEVGDHLVFGSANALDVADLVCPR